MKITSTESWTIIRIRVEHDKPLQQYPYTEMSVVFDKTYKTESGACTGLKKAYKIVSDFKKQAPSRGDWGHMKLYKETEVTTRYEYNINK